MHVWAMEIATVSYCLVVGDNQFFTPDFVLLITEDTNIEYT